MAKNLNTHCSSCKAGNYLAHTASSYGTCTAKSGSDHTLTLYVQATTNSANIQSVTGASNNAFDNLYDAITKAYEIGAQYTSATVTIKLYGGTHSMLRTNYGFYVPTKSDKYHQTTKIVI